MWLTELQIVLPDQTIERGSIRVADGLIAAAVEGDGRPAAGERVLRCRGLTAIPGIVDMHGDMIENESEPRPGSYFPLEVAIHELDKRLAGNGITTAYASISFWDTVRRERERSTDRARRMIEALEKQRGSLLIEHLVHARYEVTTPSVAETLAELVTERKVQLLSLMDHTPGQGQYRNLEQYVDVIAKWRNVDPADVRAETYEKIKLAQEPTIWSQAAEIVALAEAERIPIASHDDDTPEKIDLMADLGVAISEFPVTLEAAREAHRRGIAVAMGAPNVLRGGSHTGNVSATEAIQAGVVDMLASDYAPAALLQGVAAIVRKGIVPLHEGVRLLAQGACETLGLRDRGRIAEGLAADLALVELGEPARVRATIRRGLPIYWDGEVARRTGQP